MRDPRRSTSSPVEALAVLLGFFIFMGVALTACGGGGTGMPGGGCPPNCGTPPPPTPTPTPPPTPPPASVTGKVVIDGSSTGIASATVHLGSLSTTTDGSGNYSFSNVAILESPTVLYLQITASGYATENTGAQLVSGANVVRTIGLIAPTATETTFLSQVNTDRSNNGAGAVALDTDALRAARAHANDMNAQGYASHWDTTGHKPYARYATAGGVGFNEENWASGFANSAACETALMSDSAHKGNIIDPNHNWVGLAVAGGSPVVCDQEFVTTNAVFDPTVLGTSIASGTNATILFRFINGTTPSTSVSDGSEPIPSALTPSQLNAPPYNMGYTFPLSGGFLGSTAAGDPTLLRAPFTFSPANGYLLAVTANGVGFSGALWLEAH